MGLLIPCSQELVGSNPTPRAYLRVLYQNNKSQKAKDYHCKDYLSKNSVKIRHVLPRKDSNTLQQITLETVYRKINSIIRTCSKPYFSQILKKLANEGLANANIICDYIIAEQNELNIKNAAKQVSSSLPSIVYVDISAFNQKMKIFDLEQLGIQVNNFLRNNHGINVVVITDTYTAGPEGRVRLRNGIWVLRTSSAKHNLPTTFSIPFEMKSSKESLIAKSYWAE